MGDIVIVDFGEADCIDELLVEDCGVDEGGEESLDLLLVAERGVHLVGLLLEGGHFALDGLEVVLEPVQHLLQLLHDPVGHRQLVPQTLQLLAHLHVVVRRLPLDHLQLLHHRLAHVPQVQLLQLLRLLGQGQQLALDIVGALLR